MAKKMDKPAYEEKWQQAFEDAEISPSADLWKNIDAQLTQQESGKYKRGFFFYRAVAAACLLCLIGLGMYVASDYLPLTRNNTHLLTRDQESKALPPAKIPADQKPSPAIRETPEAGTRQEAALAENQAQRPEENSSVPSTRPYGSENSVSQADRQETQHMATSRHTMPVGQRPENLRQPTGSSRTGLPDFVSPQGLAGNNSQKGADWFKAIDYLYRVPDVAAGKTKKKEKQTQTFFAGLNFSGNYFDPNFSSSSNAMALSEASPDQSRNFFNLTAGDAEGNLIAQPGSGIPNAGVKNTPQVSISYGADVGIHLSKHLSLESGIDYGRFNTNTATNWVIESLDSDKRYPLLLTNSREVAYNNVSYTSTTELTNSFELLSFPLKLGYNFLFEKLNLFISSGMAANFFIENSITDSRGQFARVNVQAGSESPYRNVFYSGIISGGANFNFTGNYFLTLSPEYNFSITQMTKEGAMIMSQPYSFGIDLGLRYQFR